MADIKTRDAVKGTIKTIDKAAIASQRMKNAYAKIPLSNMRLTGYPVPQGVLEMRVSINLTSRGRKVFRLPEKISVRQRISSLILKQKGQ